MSAAGKILVTGAAGYVGGALARALIAQGHSVVAGARRPVPDLPTLPFDLDAPPDRAALMAAGIAAVVHAAYDFRPRDIAVLRRRNVDGSARLFEAAAGAGVRRIVHISSISAFEGCASVYGRTKLATEAVARDHAAIRLRPGLVVGANPGGMVGTLAALARRLPAVPLIGDGRAPLYMVRERDLCAVVADSVGADAAPPHGPLAVAWPEAADLRSILAALAAKAGKRPLLVPIPTHAIRWAIAAAEATVPGFPLRSDSVVSLLNPDPNPPFDRALFARLRFEPVRFEAPISA